MKYTLITDIGNSQIEFAIFDDETLVGKTRFRTSKINSEYDEKLLKNFIKESKIDPKDITGGMIFSVVPHITRLVQIIIKGEIGVELPIFKPSQLKDFKANVDDEAEIGQDLIADIVGAIHEVGAPCVIADLGTVTKNIIIDKDGVFQGVSFFPGLRSNARSLSENTAILPELKKIEKPSNFYGKNTIDAMTSGIYYSHASAIKRFMERTQEEFGYKFNKVITGGYSNILEGEVDKNTLIDPDLVLKGMNLILKYHLK